MSDKIQDHGFSGTIGVNKSCYCGSVFATHEELIEHLEEQR